MEIKLNKKDALARLSVAMKMVKGHEVFEDSLCSRDGDSLKLVSTDGVSTFETRIDVVSGMEDFEPFMMPVSSIVKSVSLFKGDEFSMIVDGGTLKVKSGRNYAKFALKDKDGFTVPCESDYKVSFSMAQSVFSSIFSLVGSIINIAHAKEVMRCILFDFEGDSCNVVSSDGGRVGCYEISTGTSFQSKFVVPYQAFGRCQQMADGDVTMMFSDSKYRIECGGCWFSSPLSNQTYPSYKSFFPASFSDEFEVSKQDLVDAIGLVKLSLTGGNSFCRFLFGDNMMTVESVTKAVEVHQEIEIVHSGSVDMLVNPTSILGAVKNLDSVKFSLNGSSSPFLITGDNARYLFAPCRWSSKSGS